jgi:hypothetical protein
MFSNAREWSREAEEGSVYERVLGTDFVSLDPALRGYFGSIPDGFVGVGSGTYRSAGLRARALRPLFALLGRWGIAFAEFGQDVPFSIRNLEHPDGSRGALRTFEFSRATRTMRDVMRVERGRIVDRVGRSGVLEVEFDARVSSGRLRMESGRLAARLFGFRFPLPRIVRVVLIEEAQVGGTQRVDVRMRAPLLGEIYGYSGTFTYELRPDGARDGAHEPVRRRSGGWPASSRTSQRWGGAGIDLRGPLSRPAPIEPLACPGCALHAGRQRSPGRNMVAVCSQTIRCPIARLPTTRRASSFSCGTVRPSGRSWVGTRA